jgi:DNA-binding MarR family transcriptional regulator
MTTNSLPSLPCFCATLRRTARSLTQFYEDALRPFGFHSTQFTILQALDFIGEATQGRLGEILALDSTTLTRTLAIMKRQGWIAERRGQDRRERWLHIAPRGRKAFEAALPAWQAVQEKLRAGLNKRDWDEFQTLANRVTDLALMQGDKA